MLTLNTHSGLWFRLVLVSFGCAMFALFIGQGILARQEQTQLLRYGQQVLNQGTVVANESREILNRVLTLNNPPCSSADLKELRLMSFYSVYLRDIGRIKNNYLICSAGWGVLNPPVFLLPPNLTTADGIHLWTATNKMIDPRIIADMASLNGVATITAAAAFHHFTHPPAGYSAMLTTRNREHVYQTFGNVMPTTFKQLPLGENSWLTMGKRQTFFCATNYNICVLAQLDSAGILYRPWYVIVSLLFVGGLIGASFALFYQLYYERHHALSSQLKRAIKYQRFQVHYQPLISLPQRAIVGVEALARWKNERGANVSPEHFISIAEKTGCSAELTRIITRQALHDMQPYLTQEAPFILSINLSVSDIVSPDYHDFLRRSCDALGIDRTRIMLELTERSGTSHQALADSLWALQRLGYKIALDDFGTGYSNLDYLARLPFDILKIDKIFVCAIGTDSLKAAMAELLFTLIQKLDIPVVIEGVETREQAAYILQRCPSAMLQGWYFGKAVAVHDLPDIHHYSCPPIETT
ncbi:EAL domain-containing protein [Samsonia erythrinae]|uniref:cyclic-guanylate-specific phosphodiesterase n=1 Tax=Samsonia erythrinae TaxID=160434 RepID=A0A4R3VNQ9_9GAMM|nr:EAL domain-containing protein [Samsonia erythrinae]TCV05764.1 sensor c-di-GMP phosphodiesterase-like protein [Samsonia erythrinae]